MTCFPFCRKNKAKQKEPVATNEAIPGMKDVKMFSYKELQNATGDFSYINKVGEGGFGSVYRGTLKDGTVVAVKVLSLESRQGPREFLTEINTVSGIVHQNLVKLLGCCAEENHRILVYDYLENNSLSQTLLGRRYSNIQFNWKTRVKICIGVACGLAYLHEELRPRIVHRDIKASNILLDKDLSPKISDFGLAKLLPANTTHVSTRVAGTIGYLAPEYAIRGQVTRKSDIYSFGVLLLEIVSGRCNTNTRLPSEEQFLLERSPDVMNGFLVLQTWTLYERGELSQIIDTTMGDDLNVEEACRFLKVGLLCTQDAAKLRPSMSIVLQMLRGEKEVELDKDAKPGLVYDFMDLKIRSQKKVDAEASSSMSMSSGIDTPSTGVTMHPSLTFTAISERD